jgi:uroporphyrinogen decarboxylase
MVNSKTIESFEGASDKERLLAAFKRKPVDRVPNFEILYEDKHVEKLLGRYAGNTLSYGGDPAKGADADQGRPMYPDDFLDFCEIIGQDAMLVGSALWVPFMRLNDKGSLVPAYDRKVKTSQDFARLVIDSDSQISETIKYLEEYNKAIAKRNSRIGVGVLCGSITQTLYEFVVGMNDFMMMVYENRELLEEMLEVSTVHSVNMVRALIKNGVDFIFVADDVAFKSGLFIPPKIMREVWVPRIARIFEPAVNAGIPVMFHSDGKIDDMVEDLIEIGIDCLNPMDPYGVNYAEYKKRYGNRICLSGNVDIEFPLSNGTPEEVDADVKAHMDVLKPGFGYVATVSHSVVNYIPHENLIAHINAIHKYGIY